MASRRGKKNMTPEQERELLELVRDGSYPAQAARQLGLSDSAVSMRKARNPEFRAALQAAEAGYEFDLIESIRDAAKGDEDRGKEGEWKAAAWLAERRFPERWSKPEIRAQLTAVNVDTTELARAISAGLALVAARHADWDEPDQDGDAEPGSGTGPPEAPRAGVSRS